MIKLCTLDDVLGIYIYSMTDWKQNVITYPLHSVTKIQIFTTMVKYNILILCVIVINDIFKYIFDIVDFKGIWH